MWYIYDENFLQKLFQFLKTVSYFLQETSIIDVLGSSDFIQKLFRIVTNFIAAIQKQL